MQTSQRFIHAQDLALARFVPSESPLDLLAPRFGGIRVHVSVQALDELLCEIPSNIFGKGERRLEELSCRAGHWGSLPSKRALTNELLRRDRSSMEPQAVSQLKSAAVMTVAPAARSFQVSALSRSQVSAVLTRVTCRSRPKRCAGGGQMSAGGAAPKTRR